MTVFAEKTHWDSRFATMQMMTMMKMKPQRPLAAAIIMFALETVKKTKILHHKQSDENLSF